MARAAKKVLARLRVSRYSLDFLKRIRSVSSMFVGQINRICLVKSSSLKCVVIPQLSRPNCTWQGEAFLFSNKRPFEDLSLRLTPLRLHSCHVATSVHEHWEPLRKSERGVPLGSLTAIPEAVSRPFEASASQYLPSGRMERWSRMVHETRNIAGSGLGSSICLT